MKNFFKKNNKGRGAEQDDLNLDYSDFYSGKDSRQAQPDSRFDEPRREEPARERAGGYYDVPKPARGGYEEPDFRPDNNSRYYENERPAERPAERVVERVVERPAPVEQPVAFREESPVRARETWQEADAPGYRPTPAEVETAPAPAPVFTPAPAPEYLYFTPSTYRDCREGIVKGLATGHVVVVRLRKLEAGDVLRLFDYMMGAVLALDGELVRPASTTVVLVPKDVELKEEDIEPDEEEELVLADEESDEEYDEDEYDEYDEEDTYENGEYGSYDEDEYEDEYDEEEYEDEAEYEEYEDEDEYDDEYDDAEYEDEYDDDEYEDDESEEEYEDEESDEERNA